ncbi:4231_t:CDS:2 [Entrophospora sp. SA101]|nr:4231_t:CDS:2 [Entrophospora sp. SA101]CAJ0912141.1 303_t:CDS:2 [Entrophospora sp. SA101]
MKLGDINYNDRLVFGILGYLYEMKMTIMWKDGIYIYEEFGSFTIASHIGMIHQMKAGITKLLEFIEESSKIRHFSFNGDEVQILKRKFQEIITQTQESPPKRPKSKAASFVVEESSKIRHFSFNGDEVQILKRKFQEIITQTQESPPKRPKSKAAC